MSGWFVYATKKSSREMPPVIKILARLSGKQQEWKSLYVLSAIEHVAKIWKTKKDAERAKKVVEEHRTLTLDWRQFGVVSLAELDRYRIERELAGD